MVSEAVAVKENTGVPANSDASRRNSDLARRAAHGAAALVGRQALVYGSNIAGGVILARFLSPSEFGFYGIVVFFVAFLNIFGGTGFASNLIRTEEEASISDYRAVFTGQQIGIAVLFGAIWLVSPWLGAAYHVPHGVAFFRVIGVALVLTSFMVIPQVQMERELAFDKLALVEVVQALVFNVGSVVLAWRGFGVLSFSIALGARAAIGALLSNAMHPWPMRWHWDSSALRRHLRFGLAVQAGQLISMAKDSITPAFVGLYLGAAQMGYVTWAATLAGYPVMMLMTLQRLYMPFFARLQSDRKEFAKFVSHALWMANAIAAPLTMITIGLAHPITTIVFGAKWLAALPLFYCFAAGILFSPSSTPLLGALNAIGKSNFTLLVTGMWMGLTWIFGVPLIMKFGLMGFGVAMILVQLSNVFLYWLAKVKLSVSVWPAYWPSWPVAAMLSLLLGFLQHWMPIRTIAMLIMVGTATALMYAVILWLGFPVHTRGWVRVLQRRPAVS